MMKKLRKKEWFSTGILTIVLLIISIASLFVGAIEIDPRALLSGGDPTEVKIFFLGRVPRLLAILCTGAGMSVAGLITQQLSTYLSGSFALILKGNYELVYLVLPLVVFAFFYANHFNIVEEK